VKKFSIGLYMFWSIFSIQAGWCLTPGLLEQARPTEQGNASAQYRFHAWHGPDRSNGYRGWDPEWYRLGRKDLSGYDLKTFYLAAEGGDIEAQYQLGLKYYHGEGVARNFEIAANYLHHAAIRIIAGAFSERPPATYEALRKADLDLRASRGDLPARFYLGIRYLSGAGVPKNFEQAATCFKEVIELGGELPWPPFGGNESPRLSLVGTPDQKPASRTQDLNSMLEFGSQFYSGKNAKSDDSRAARWFRLAAERANRAWRDRDSVAGFSSLSLPELKARSADGDPEARFELAERYFFGRGIEKNLSEAAKWYRLAAAEPGYPLSSPLPRGNIVPDSNLQENGLDHSRGYYPGIPRLTEEDIRFLREYDPIPAWYYDYRFADVGHEPEALDKMVRAGAWHEPFPLMKYRDTYRWYRDMAQLRKEAEDGDPDAQFHLGAKYYFGEGISINKEEASNWFRKSAMKGNPMARYYLGLVYERHEDRIALEGAARKGNPEAQFQMGMICHFGQPNTRDFAEASRWYELSAKQGNSMAQYQLGIIEFSRNQFSDAVKWLKKSAAQGNVPAQYNLGILYWEGKGVDKDRIEAERWFRRVAEKGGILAQGMIAIMNLTERSGDPGKAPIWLSKSVDEGLVNPRLDLALIHDEGLGFSISTKRAYAWLMLVLEGKSGPWVEEYRVGLRQLEARLSPSEIEEAKGLAEKLKASIQGNDG